MTFKKILKYILPYGVIIHKDKILDSLCDRFSFIVPPRRCPVCGKGLYRFNSWSAPYGGVEEKEVECPRCRSHPRHRKLWVYLSRHTKFFKLKNLYFLHIAPEGCLKEKFKKLFDNYLTADISGHAMVQMDITDIKYPDNSFDIIMCNHVLEHIPDDIKAMSELYHVLKKGGMAILLVPMNLYSDQTYEDWSVVTPEGRVKAFGQHDHVRIYGKDYLERLQSVGFGVSAVLGNEYLSPREMKKYSGINRHDDVIVTCTK